ncbi:MULTISPECIES: TVP38/TMEM64 family protein [Colwellia]|uniref:TVP38/TMEM64 family membrane protein n=1 Tax=Colwellia psychrerythraea (strain 34H / ATCC BAA-681) TaxID=167879 RepID=Q48AL0_COLP3|nr:MULTISPECIES: VTT domain-containing protein [Colwellia]AAZ24997.1 putative membrane protein [Colwellia psychrerythraea 34H]PKH88300.1 DedA family protein [Colwellia sp. Bg11-28]
MLSKFLLFSARLSTTKILASLIIIMILATGLYQWLIHTPAFSPQVSAVSTTTENDFSLTDWTINLVDKLNWQQGGSSTFFNAGLLFVFLSLATSVGLPRQIAALVAGINLGAFIGIIVATLAATLGCFITFSVARYLLSDCITRKYPSKLAQLSAFLGEQTFLKAIVIRILPLGSNFITNIIAGVSKVSMPAYVSGSFVGFIPQMVIFSLAGSGIRLGAQNELIASATLFVIALILTTYLVKKHKAKTKN